MRVGLVPRLLLAFLCASGWTGSAAAQSPLRFRVLLPGEAELRIDGVLTKQTGEVRRFETPAVEKGEYRFVLDATWKHVSYRREIRLTTGQEPDVDLRLDLAAELFKVTSKATASQPPAAASQPPIAVSKPAVPPPPETSLPPPVPPTVAKRSPRSPLQEKYLRPKEIPFPKTNPRTDAAVSLGKTLFFDPRLSGSRSLACVSCHSPALGWSDGNPKAIGTNMAPAPRRSPTVSNLAWGVAFFWDGRVEALELQPLATIANPKIMNLRLDDMVERLTAVPGYAPLFEKAFPGQPISKENVGRALATFQRTIVSGRAPFDEWIDGDDQAISESAKRGFALFNGRAACASCHRGWRFSDDSFHDTGLPGNDRGRGNILKDIEISQYAFKTPTLRDLRGPFMHDGSLTKLEDVLELYNKGGLIKRPSLSREIRPLQLSPEEKSDLLAFLGTLNSPYTPFTIPDLPR